MKKRFLRFLALSLLFVMTLNSTHIPAQAAIPEVSGNNYIATHLLSTKNNVPVYADSARTQRGTASPYKLYNATVYASDEFRITEVNLEQGWAYGSYPTSSGRRYGYINLSDFTSYNASTDAMTSKARLSVLDRPGGSVYGTIFVDDTVYRISEYGEFSQVIFNTSTGFKAGWLRTSDYNKHINVGHEPQGYSDIIKFENDRLIVRGWVFDRDNLSENITLHIYIGGPAGSSSAFAAYAITASKHRPDVPTVYPGVGDYHGYHEEIQLNTTRTGACEVYVYAINIGGGSNNPLIGKGTVYLGSGNTDTTAAQAVSNRLNTLINTYKGTQWNGYYMGSQCKGFANLIFKSLFGVYIGPYEETTKAYIQSPNGATEVGRLTTSTMSLNACKELLMKAQPGDYIQVRRRGKTYGHSMIVVNTSNSGITVFDCNSDGQNGVKVYDISWQNFYSSNSAMSLYHAKNYK